MVQETIRYYLDHEGRGIPMIMKSMKEVGAKEPLLQKFGEEFIKRIFRVKTPTSIGGI